MIDFRLFFVLALVVIILLIQDVSADEKIAFGRSHGRGTQIVSLPGTWTQAVPPHSTVIKIWSEPRALPTAYSTLKAGPSVNSVLDLLAARPTGIITNLNDPQVRPTTLSNPATTSPNISAQSTGSEDKASHAVPNRPAINGTDPTTPWAHPTATQPRLDAFHRFRYLNLTPTNLTVNEHFTSQYRDDFSVKIYAAFEVNTINWYCSLKKPYYFTKTCNECPIITANKVHHDGKSVEGNDNNSNNGCPKATGDGEWKLRLPVYKLYDDSEVGWHNYLASHDKHNFGPVEKRKLHRFAYDYGHVPTLVRAKKHHHHNLSSHGGT